MAGACWRPPCFGYQGGLQQTPAILPAKSKLSRSDFEKMPQSWAVLFTAPPPFMPWRYAVRHEKNFFRLSHLEIHRIHENTPFRTKSTSRRDAYVPKSQSTNKYSFVIPFFSRDPKISFFISLLITIFTKPFPFFNPSGTCTEWG